MNEPIHLLTIGDVDRELAAWLKRQLSAALDCEVVVAPEIPLPTDGYDHRRLQFRGDAVMAALRDVPHPAAARVLGLIDADCYVRDLNFIFGQAILGGREAFVALPRLRQSFYGLEEDPGIFRKRLLKEAMHELGHTLGLPHCPFPNCVMLFSNTLHDTDLKGSTFCPKCKERLRMASEGEG
jgi:archaemetzincin